MTTIPIPASRPLVLFTDLDGTLIDHHTYSADIAIEALHLLEQRGVPLVFCSSKTFAEQIRLQQKMGISQPFIFENGSAVAVPKRYFPTPPPLRPVELHGGTDRHDIYVFAHADARAIRTELALIAGIKSFSTAPNTAVSAATGLTGEALQDACERWFTETLLTPLDEGQVARLQIKLMEKGWMLSRGGRFYTVQSAQAGKGKAVQWLKEVFRQNMPEEPLFAAVGDSPNDASMLATVDYPFLVRRHDGTWSDLASFEKHANPESPEPTKIEGIGPAGFLMAVGMLLGKPATRW